MDVLLCGLNWFGLVGWMDGWMDGGLARLQWIG